MIEKIIDFVTLPFVFVTDLIEMCTCKHRYKIPQIVFRNCFVII